ncbi:serine/threonine kinase family protein [Plesiocystis pacifica SIR-1]|uniref:Serine/threonine kinase family protein n=1 Tax=Plesiocystis pacifica SIR-1 TaxID=391625 RepID=A6GEK4_9BACT|nr:serine/threonine-protein kinase [Plesiocystis pacifica]EDM75712.1 serine/threonine kinase family protein [Plesiocystis pacifica SIR-1]
MVPGGRDINGGTADTMLSELSSYSFGEDTVAATIGGDGEHFEEEMPERVGRYLILDRLGAGGMGVVYSAYDPDLDRKLAIKLLHGDDGRSERATLRLLREAQALARVSHPNVIQVYDIGTVDERVYIAMEFVDGQSLKSWLREEARSLAQILATFSQAGHGLAAAHACKLVHRDFKPDNVIVTPAGRVVVLDFGIAHALARAEDPDHSLDESIERRRFIEHSASHRLASTEERELSRSTPSIHERSGTTSLALDTELTRAGAMVGTPAYMAPEQFDSAETDARADQFSFCVALWEAIHGRRPYLGESPLALWQAVRDGKLQPPSTRRVPPKLHRALVRGLQTEPEDRFASMDELLAVVDRDPRATQRRISAGVVFAMALVAGAWGLDAARRAGQAEQGPQCTGAQARIAESWNPQRRAALEAAFGGTELPFAAKVAPTVIGALDGYAHEWQLAHTDACEATHVRGEQSAALLDLRMSCLERRRAGLDALVEVLLEPDATVVENSIEAVHKLPAIAACGDRSALEASEAQASEARSAGEGERIAILDEALTRARARRDAGDVEGALAIVEGAHTRLRATVDPQAGPSAAMQAATARASLEHGLTQLEGGNFDAAGLNLHEAFYGALATGDASVQLDAALALLQLTGDRQKQFEAAGHWARIARALVEQHERRGAALAVGGEEDGRAPSRERVLLEYFVGLMHWRQGELDEAQAELEGALALASASTSGAAPGEDIERELLAIRVRKGLGSVLWAKGEAEAAAEQFQLVVDTLRATLGASHPKVGSALNNLASAHFAQGRYTLAEAEFIETLDLFEGSYGEGHPSVLNAFNNLAVVRGRQGKQDAARETLERIVELQAKHLDADDPQRASTWSNLGRVYNKLGRYEQAAEVHAKAYALRRSVFGEEHDESLSSLEGLATAQVHLGEHERGLASLQVALDARVETLGEDHPSVAETLVVYAHARAAIGERRAAVGLLRRALALRERNLTAEHPDLAANLALLAALLIEDGERDEARALIERYTAMEAAAAPPATDRARAHLCRARLAEPGSPEVGEQARAGLELLEAFEDVESKALRRALEAAAD